MSLKFLCVLTILEYFRIFLEIFKRKLFFKRTLYKYFVNIQKKNHYFNVIKMSFHIFFSQSVQISCFHLQTQVEFEKRINIVILPSHTIFS